MVCLRAMQLYIFQNMEGNLNNSYSLQIIYDIHYMNHILFTLLQFTIVSNYTNHKQLTKSHCEKPSAV